MSEQTPGRGGEACPVICIDGPNASGKGTVSQILAQRLGWHLLDSGALYRLVALSATRTGVSLDEPEELADVAIGLDVAFVPGDIGEPVLVHLSGKDVTTALRTEACGALASKVAAYPPVRAALLARQRAFRTAPGLVADGRDMGTVVFVDAPLKIFLTASAEVRAMRRYNQLSAKGNDVNLAALSVEIAERDRQDRERTTAPLRIAEDAHLVDTSERSIEAVLECVLKKAIKSGLGPHF
ncbi:MAG: cytidylate kinase [Gammaproteobacteria bacterium]|jgi:cytidylate kinase